MPIYEYSCQKCGQHMEVMRKISDKPLTRHPKCGGKLTKEWSRTGFQFKGEGWYVTDYAAKKPEAKEEAKEETKEVKETKSEATESKPKGEKTADAKPSKKTKTPATGAD